MVASAKQVNTASARSELHMLAKLVLVVTRDMIVSQNKNFGRNPNWSYVKPVVYRGPTVVSKQWSKILYH
jgi:hypothetical protein